MGAAMRKHIAFASMCIGLFIAQLDIQIVSASLNEIGGGLSAGKDEMAWIQTSYLIAEIIIIPLSGWLSRVFSTRWLFTLSAGVFTVMSVACALAWNIQSMIVFRALQGAAGASMIPLVFTTAFIYYQGKELGLAAAVVSALASLSPTLGPTLGGWITDNLEWRWLFYINILPGLYLVMSIPLLVDIDKPNLSLLKGADYLGIALLALTLGCLEYSLEEGARWGWFDDSTIIVTSGLTLVSALLFATRTLTISNPIMDLYAFSDKNFSLGCFFSFAGGVGIFSTVYLTPVFLGQVRGFSAMDIGLAVCTTGIFQILSVPLYLYLSKRINLQWLLMAGLGGFAFSMFLFTPITHQWGWQELLLPQAIRGVSQQFAMAPIVTLTLGGIPKERLKLASGVFNLTRNLGGAIGIALCGTILNNRTNFHYQRIGEKIVSVPQTVNEFITRYTVIFIQGGSDGTAGPLAATKLLGQMMMQEAQTMAFSDAFLLVSLLLFMAFALVPAMGRKQ
ncbi:MULTISPECIES: DHA2 family efflux MFS transporter permease subunit [Enterobacteriaceae]|uniref:DHA2 family efflux MFS transporter permease subunit n=1 Tax=Enterobacteriaceae TaxID=543 RepID=UPI001921196D|nr:MULTISPECIES: DHA2 family efflux MFS transporter permease subunit [Enterobacteriaceae]MDF3828023.1 DHA2 family efflux MFS transporter permease subunit [Pseudocitrobacter sp. 2023EL-00150]MEB7556826.1 DHA2 family efflux MFS transporter permease subunit [Kluyvera cryocrescens]MEC5373428.1 DHA2 family efflux MFS transporter permease subunit [Pseudocitrobacter sp. MW920760]WNN69787.1 DHA2 family efflux MFS transporter permease subunit [Kluyvera cryocrescens]HDG1673441.1 DHA2 family efflux MFS t